jgi:hypothetical protein
MYLKVERWKACVRKGVCGCGCEVYEGGREMEVGAFCRQARCRMMQLLRHQ